MGRCLQKQQSKKEANESAFSFLVNPKDADGKRPGEEGYDPRTLYIPKSAWAQFTPFEQQFWEIKQYHFDVVLFFQKGKFFELVSISHSCRWLERVVVLIEPRSECSMKRMQLSATASLTSS